MTGTFLTGHGTKRAQNRDGRTVPSLDEPAFLRALWLERRRSERSGRYFLLMLVRTNQSFNSQGPGILAVCAKSLEEIARETDVIGWFERERVLGGLFTEIGSTTPENATPYLERKIRERFNAALGERSQGVEIRWHRFPEDFAKEGLLGDHAVNQRLFRKAASSQKTFSRIAKRTLDVTGSMFACLLLAPVFLACAIAVKLSSKGTVLFRQERVGQFGNTFTFLKFRTMHVASDSAPHRSYVEDFIRGKASEQSVGNGSGVYKLVGDPRVTRVGVLLRRTSLDELPQLFNVLRGEMSLVGPRPSIPYELEVYEPWHRRRVLEVKPGITGLWQVKGRSRTKFDEMVRLDLQYAKSWSLWLDLKILLMTPGAVLTGEGAY